MAYEVHDNGHGDPPRQIMRPRLDAQGHWEPIRYEPFANYEQREYFVRGTARGKAIQ